MALIVDFPGRTRIAKKFEHMLDLLRAGASRVRIESPRPNRLADDVMSYLSQAVSVQKTELFSVKTGKGFVEISWYKEEAGERKI